MANEIERRLAALERKAGPSADRVSVIIRRMVTPGIPPGEAATFVSINPGAAGWRVDREPGETEAAFLERARATAPRSVGGIARLLQPAA